MNAADVIIVDCDITLGQKYLGTCVHDGRSQ